jgi:two-component system LytT family response regulator
MATHVAIASLRGFQFLTMEKIGCFVYHTEKHLWQAMHHDASVGLQVKTLRRDTTADDLLLMRDYFVQINQRRIINLNFLHAIEGSTCVLHPPFDKIDGLGISRTYMAQLKERFVFL